MAQAPAAVTNIVQIVPDSYKKYLQYLLPVVALAVGLAISAFGMVPAINDDSVAKASADASALRLSAMGSKISQLKSLTQDQTTLTEDLAKASAAMPSDKDVAGLLANINQDANASNATVQSAQLIAGALSSGTSGSQVQNKVVSFQLSIAGPFPVIKDFLTKVETTRRVIVVKTLAINGANSTSLTADMSIETYYEPEPNVQPGSDDPLPTLSSQMDKILADLDSRTNYVPAIPTPSSAGRSDPFSGF